MEEVITQARKQNTVHFLTDLDYAFEHEPLWEYGDTVDAFDKLYVNLSANNRRFEFLCFARWFVLYQYMRDNDIPMAFYCDSDVLLFADVNEEYRTKFSQYDLTLIEGGCMASSFVSQERLGDFLSFVTRFYTDKRLLAPFLDFYGERQRRGLGGGICDMTFIKKYAKTVPYAEMTDVRDGSTYDHTLLQVDGYDSINDEICRRKYVEFYEGIPFFRQETSGVMVKANSLHCQGESDKEIPVLLEMAKGN